MVYCRQGHELYMGAVRDERVYPCKSQRMPYQKYSLLPQEFCQVANVRFLVGPPTLCSITLGRPLPPALPSAVCSLPLAPSGVCPAYSYAPRL